MSYTPPIGSEMTIDLPGERLRAAVVEMLDDDHIVVALTNGPMLSVVHGFRKDANINVERKRNDLGETWEPYTPEKRGKR